MIHCRPCSTLTSSTSYHGRLGVAVLIQGAAAASAEELSASRSSSDRVGRTELADKLTVATRTGSAHQANCCDGLDVGGVSAGPHGVSSIKLAILEKIVEMLSEKGGKMAPNATTMKPTSRAYSIRSCPRVSRQIRKRYRHIHIRFIVIHPTLSSFASAS